MESIRRQLAAEPVLVVEPEVTPVAEPAPRIGSPQDVQTARAPDAVEDRRRDIDPLPELGGLNARRDRDMPSAGNQVPQVVRRILLAERENWIALSALLADRSKSQGLRSVQVACRRPGEGCTTIAIALSLALSHATDRRVLLIDGSFSRPAISRALRLSDMPSLAHVVLRMARWQDAIQTLGGTSLSVLASRSLLSDATDLLAHPRLGEIMIELKERFDLVIVDGGAVQTNEPLIEPFPRVDAAVLVRDPRATTEASLDAIDDHLANHGVTVLGEIQNSVDEAMLLCRA